VAPRGYYGRWDFPASANCRCPRAEAPEHRLPAPTRKLMTVRFAMAAAQRINRLVDPQGHGEF
jgi:hypothetical protein